MRGHRTVSWPSVRRGAESPSPDGHGSTKLVTGGSRATPGRRGTNRTIEGRSAPYPNHERRSTTTGSGDPVVTIDERVLFGIVLAAGVVLPGAADYALSMAGYDTVGMVVWIVGYFGMVLAVWYRWIRPLDFTGPVEE